MIFQMKLLFDYFKKSIVNYCCGSTLTNTKIRNLIALHFIDSIRKKSIVGNHESNFLSYDTMYIVYLPDTVYNKIRKELIMIVQSATKEIEYILKTKIDSKKYPNYDLPHSPYWQFLFQPVPKGSKIPDSGLFIDDNYIKIDSETFPEGRNENTVDQGDKVRVSIRSKRSTGMSETYFNKKAFIGINPVSEGEFVVPFGIYSSKKETPVSRQSTLLTLTISNASFLIDGRRSTIYRMTTNDIYIAGRNANDVYNNIRVLRIDDNHIMNPQLHIQYVNGIITVDAKGEVTYRNRRIESTGVAIPKGSSLLINNTIQIEIN